MVMKNKLTIKGFKCFDNISLELNNISILVGANGAGKSSIIQAILLLTKGFRNKDNNNKALIPVNDVLGVDFGKVDNIFNDKGLFSKDIANVIKISLDDCSVTSELKTDDNSEHTLTLQLDYLPYETFPLGNTIHFLDAERIGPRYICEFKGDDIDSCGAHGENTAYVWEKHSNDKLDIEKRFKPDNTGSFSILLTEWLDFIFENISLRVVKIFDRALQIQVTNHTTETTMLSVGFGISYALPILVEGLLLKKGDCLIVENPEAHLQPKAQIRIGYFLAVMASSGVKIILETHSEHVIKGIIKATTDESINFTVDDIAIYYVTHKHDEKIKSISIIDAKNDNYPDDFFDSSTDILDKTIKDRKPSIKI